VEKVEDDGDELGDNAVEVANGDEGLGHGGEFGGWKGTRFR